MQKHVLIRTCCIIKIVRPFSGEMKYPSKVTGRIHHNKVFIHQLNYLHAITYLYVLMTMWFLGFSMSKQILCSGIPIYFLVIVYFWKSSRHCYLLTHVLNFSSSNYLNVIWEWEKFKDIMYWLLLSCTSVPKAYGKCMDPYVVILRRILHFLWSSQTTEFDKCVPAHGF